VAEPRLPEPVARAICAKAMLTDRCAELIGVLMENGSVTLDRQTNELVFITEEQLRDVMKQSFGDRPERFYVESTAAWADLADRHVEDSGATGALAGALVTLCDAYEYARTFDE